MKVKVVVPLFNNVDTTKNFVASILQSTHPDLFECYFVDNGSTDGTAEFLKQLVRDRPENFRVITSPVNKGFGGGVNLGLRAISSKEWNYACILNNDVVLPKDWIPKLLEVWKVKPDGAPIGAVAPVSNNAGGVQGIPVNYKTLKELRDFGTARFDTIKDHPGRFLEAGMLVGLCFLMTREFFEKVGLFDEQFFPGMWEDNDYCLRGKMEGFRFFVDQAVFLHHEMSKTFRSNGFDSRKIFDEGKIRLQKKWKGLWKPNQKLIAAMRVKDGGKDLPRTLERLSEFTDGIVVLVDQHTTDNTYEIAKRYKKVIRLEKETPHPYNEAVSRNQVLDFAREAGADWIWNADHDEVPEKLILDPDIRNSLMYPTNPETMLWTFPIVQLWNSEKTQRVDGLWGRFLQGRMYRVLPHQVIQNGNDKIHCGSHPHFSSQNFGQSHLRIFHYGNIDAAYRKKKFDWYTKTDTQKDLNMVLGSHKEFYWKLYYGEPQMPLPNPRSVTWTVDHSDTWDRPAYGTFKARDCYRHVIDETSLKLANVDEENTIGLCMLAHNEGSMIQKCISSVAHIVSQIVVVDSSDNLETANHADRLGAEIHPYKWENDFSKARNLSVSKMKTKWILRLDPDESVPEGTAEQILNLVKDASVDGYIFPIANFLTDPEKSTKPTIALSETCRLFQNSPDLSFKGAVHEELDDSFHELSRKRELQLKADGLSEEEIQKRRPLARVVKVPFEIWHEGYLRDPKFLEQKFDYYCKLGLQQIAEKPNDFRSYFTVAVHYQHIGEWSKAITYYLKTLELDPKHWMAYNDLASIYHRSGKLHEAKKLYKKAYDLLPEGVHQLHRERVSQNLESLNVELLLPLIHSRYEKVETTEVPELHVISGG